MDFELLIYVILGVVYFLSRMLKKPEQEPGNTPPPQRPQRRTAMDTVEDRPVEKPKPLTFEELLREITEAKQPRQREPEPEPSYESYEMVPAEEARSLESVETSETRTPSKWAAYEQVQVETERRSLEDTLKLENTRTDFERFSHYEKKEEKSRADEYRKLLANPESLRQAVVLTEILNRRF